jgi:thymidylate kinase
MPEHSNPRAGGAAAIAPFGQALDVLLSIMASLDEAGIRYCHWKSNYHIGYAMSAAEDVDILIDRSRWSEFVVILLQHNFKAAASVTSRNQPGVFHFLGNDDATGTFVNVHAYARILTGDHFLKSWALPFERLLLEHTHEDSGIRIPDASSEILIFVIRNMLKMTTLVDLFYATRAAEATLEECHWLLERTDLDTARKRLAVHFPQIPDQDFLTALNMLKTRSSLWSRIPLGLRFARQLGQYRRYGPVRQSLVSAVFALRLVINKFVRRQKHMHLLTGGKIIALVGPQATGKSTLVAALAKWLGAELKVTTIHAGKPPSTLATLLPNALIPLVRRLAPRQATIVVEKKLEETPEARLSPVFVVRKVMLAYERKALLRRAFRATRNGAIVVCDRYPSDALGAIDGATFSDATIARQSWGLIRWLMRLERKLYDSVCPPDVVVKLTVSVEKAVERNRTRDKKGNQTTDYVRLRHAMRTAPRFERCPSVELSTDADLDETCLRLKRIVWPHL